MPVILDPGSDAMKTWLDPSRTTWSKELQSILKPYEGELECYPVPNEVGKVGNNSPDFIVPVNSKENKNNIANFFANAQKKQDSSLEKKIPETKIFKHEKSSDPVPGFKREHTPDTPVESKKPKVHPTTPTPSPQKTAKKMRSATHNTPMKKPVGKKPTDGSQQITNFFKK